VCFVFPAMSFLGQITRINELIDDEMKWATMIEVQKGLILLKHKKAYKMITKLGRHLSYAYNL
jgi:hypothetical protein